MKVFAVDHPLHKPDMGYVHFKLFNGVQASTRDWRPAAQLLGDEPVWPFAIVHNARYVPPVFSTQQTLVVSEPIARQLSGIPNTELRAVRFHRLVDFPVPRLGDYSYQSHPAYIAAAESEEGITSLFDHLPDAPPELAATVGNYFELIPARLSEAAVHFPQARTVTCLWPYTIDKTNELLICSELVEAYPVTWWSQTILHERVYRIIEPHLDFGYAEVVEIEL